MFDELQKMKMKIDEKEGHYKVRLNRGKPFYTTDSEKQLIEYLKEKGIL
jgi:hypothetical protein